MLLWQPIQMRKIGKKQQVVHLVFSICLKISKICNFYEFSEESYWRRYSYFMEKWYISAKNLKKRIKLHDTVHNLISCWQWNIVKAHSEKKKKIDRLIWSHSRNASVTLRVYQLDRPWKNCCRGKMPIKRCKLGIHMTYLY